MSSNIQSEIVSWAATRPGWQQTVLCELAEGKQWSDEELPALVTEIKAGAPPTRKLTEADLPQGIAPAAVSLSSIRDLKHVNALLPSQDLDLGGVGLTVVYGDNASGKSGYARLIKSAVRSLHHEDVHESVFEAQSGAQHAEINYREANKDRQASWPSEAPAELGAISFYDEACGDAYLEKDSELGYRPSALSLLDGLIALCDRVKGWIDSQEAANASETRALPDAPEGSSSETFLESVSGKTTKFELDKACELPADADAELNRLRLEEARLQGSDPNAEIARLKASATNLRLLAERVAALESKVGGSSAQVAAELSASAKTTRKAADLASSENFDSDPINAVGTDAWRSLWVAAREFSEKDAYPGRDFPVVEDGSACVLCQQPLSVEAADRLSRFDSFVKDTTAKKAEEAERKLTEHLAALEAAGTEPAGLGVARAALRADDEKLADRLDAWLEAAGIRRLALIDHPSGDAAQALPDLPASPESVLKDLAADVESSAGLIDDQQFKESLKKVVDGRKDIEGRKAVAAHRADIDAEVARRKAYEELDAAKREAETKAITRRTTELTEKYVTEEVRDRFSRESHSLALERIYLKSAGGHKGKLHQRPELLGAKTGRPVREVFSEGEQTALGLAGFFTEAYFDQSKSAIVLDDPVSSLDHYRRRKVGRRLAELALDRQVVVFTHDLEFVVALSAAARDVEAGFTERAVERRGQVPGVCVKEHPWKAKDVGRRLTELDQLLAEIKQEESNWTQQEYEEKCAGWAGKLSETWERILHLEIAQQIFDPATSEVKPRMLKVISRVTDEDEKQFQKSYSKVSGWARRHDKSPSKNPVPPVSAELEAELTVIREFQERIKAYRN
jgi:hypothetical protein